MTSTPADARPPPPGGLTCEQVLAELPDYLEGELGAPTVAAVEAHLSGCPHCATFGGAYRAMVDLLRRHRDAAR